MLLSHRQVPICLDSTDTECKQKLWKKIHFGQIIEEDRAAEVWQMYSHMIQLNVICHLCEEINVFLVKLVAVLRLECNSSNRRANPYSMTTGKIDLYET